VFFIVLRGPERVMVPDVRNMQLTDALVKLQERELYPRVSLRFTDNPQDRDTILEQSPEAGSIVKAGRRIKLTISKGAVLDKVDTYVGQDLESVKLKLQSLFSSTSALVTIRDPVMYRFDDAAPGTILEQQPLPGERISGPTVLEFVVSKGPETLKAKVPSFMGMSSSDAVAAAEKAPFTVDFAMRKPKSSEAPGTVVDQNPKPDTDAKVADRIKVTLAVPAESPDLESGIYVYDLPAYPYPVPVKLEAIKPSGQRSLIVSLKHPGGHFSAPFSLPTGSTFVLSVLDREIARTEAKSR
jgi:beta-lactam-binding protein with PASTA domain